MDAWNLNCEVNRYHGFTQHLTPVDGPHLPVSNTENKQDKKIFTCLIHFYLWVFGFPSIERNELRTGFHIYARLLISNGKWSLLPLARLHPLSLKTCKRNGIPPVVSCSSFNKGNHKSVLNTNRPK